MARRGGSTGGGFADVDCEGLLGGSRGEGFLVLSLWYEGVGGRLPIGIGFESRFNAAMRSFRVSTRADSSVAIWG